MTDFHEALRAARERFGWSVHSCAERARVSAKIYRSWEAGDEKPNRFQIKRVFGKDSPLLHELGGDVGDPLTATLADLARVVAIPKPPASRPRWEPKGFTEWSETAAEEHAQEVEVMREENRPNRYTGHLAKEPTVAPRTIVTVVENPPSTAPDPEKYAACRAATTFGECLRAARLAEALDQDSLGELVGVVGGTVSVWERDEAIPVRVNYERLRDLLPGLAFGPLPPSRDIDKPRGPEGMILGAPPPRGPARPRRLPPPTGQELDEVLSEPAPIFDEQPPPAPDGLELLAKACTASSRLFGKGSTYSALLSVDPEGWWVSMTTDGVTGSPQLDGKGASPRLALGQILGQLRAEVNRRRAELEELAALVSEDR